MIVDGHFLWGLIKEKEKKNSEVLGQRNEIVNSQDRK
jgi:hypothetical protein